MRVYVCVFVLDNETNFDLGIEVIFYHNYFFKEAFLNKICIYVKINNMYNDTDYKLQQETVTKFQKNRN